MSLQVLTPSKSTSKRKEEVLNDYITMQQVADHFKVSKASISRWARLSENPLPSHRPPVSDSKTVLFILEECEIWFRGKGK
ncbi:hypothetical protein GKC32_00535 [Lactobacillus curvatus]|nr:hypothetical protein [Latilactobacillus curvatus]MSE22961.1 hypothetical protein [Latilactobacillus curvatus]